MMSPKRPLVLIVEDEAIIAMELEDHVLSLGYEVVGLVSDGDTAIARVHERRPDVVLMDIRLRGARDGIDAAGEIRRFAPAVAIVFVTSHADEGTLARAMATAPAGFLCKPFLPSELQAALSKAVERAGFSESRPRT